MGMSRSSLYAEHAPHDLRLILILILLFQRRALVRALVRKKGPSTAFAALGTTDGGRIVLRGSIVQPIHFAQSRHDEFQSADIFE